MTDTHSHPYMADTPQLAVESVQRAISSGVDRIIMPNTDVTTIAPMKTLASRFPHNLRMAMGLHPTEIKEDAEEQLEVIRQEIYDNKELYVAVGEIGLDYYWDRNFEKKQADIFDRQLSLASDLDLPVIIHCREALDETLEILKDHPEVKAVFHSFGGTRHDVEKIHKIGDYYFGINGIVTFKNSGLRDTLPSFPIERLLLETDSPYLAPVPKRGKPNESAFLVYIAKHIGDTLNLSLDEVNRITTDNSVRLFGF